MNSCPERLNWYVAAAKNSEVDTTVRVYRSQKVAFESAVVLRWMMKVSVLT